MSENLKNNLLLALVVILYLLAGYIAPVEAKEAPKSPKVTCTAPLQTWCPDQQDIDDDAPKGLAQIKIQVCTPDNPFVYDEGVRVTCYCKDGSKVKFPLNDSCLYEATTEEIRGFCLREKICEGASTPKTKTEKTKEQKKGGTEPSLTCYHHAGNALCLINIQKREQYSCKVMEGCPANLNPGQNCFGQIICNLREPKKK